MINSWYRSFVIVILLFLSCITLAKTQDILYATNALAIDECTLHILNAASGKVLKSIGTVQNILDDSSMGIFGMCFKTGVMYAVNHLDQLVTLDVQTAKATVIGPVGINGLYDLACPRSGQEIYSFGAQDYRIIVIDVTTGQGRRLASPLPEAEAVSMDFDDTRKLWLLMDGKVLSMVDLETGSLLSQGALPGVHVNQRHGSIRGRTLYSAFFEADPSNLWQVNLDNSTVQTVLSTGLDSAYTLAFVDAASS